jgi:hypothetical protein
MASHPAPDEADHGHSLATDTLIEAVPPSAPNDRGD